MAERDGKTAVAIKSADGKFTWQDVTVFSMDDKTAKVQSIRLKEGDSIAEDAKDVPSDPAKPDPEVPTPKKS